MSDLVVNEYTGKKSLRKTIIYYTWIWALIITSIVILKVLLDPTEILKDSLVGIAWLLSTALGAASLSYVGGKAVNQKYSATPPEMPKPE